MTQKPTYEELEQRVRELEQETFQLKNKCFAFSENVECYYNAFPKIPAMLHSTDSNGFVLNVSDLWLEKMGYEKDEVIGRKVFDFYSEETKNLAQEKALPELLDKGFVENIPYKVITKDGTVIDALLSSTSLKDPSGAFKRSLAIMTDITDLKRIEDNLRESEEWFKAIFEGSRDAIFITSEDSRFAYVNHAACTLTGYSKEELLSMHVTNLYASEDLYAYHHFFDRIMAGEAMISEADILRRDGIKVSTEFSNTRVALGETLYMHTVARDISERKRYEDGLRKKDERFRHVYERMAVGVARVSFDYHIESANEAYCRMLGYSEKELIGKHLRDITHSEDVEENLFKLSQLLMGKIDHSRMEKRYIHKRGHVVYGILDVTLVRDDDDQPSYFIGSVVDITERKQAEEEREKLQNQLLQAQKMESVGRLAGGVAHDLNNMLLAILGYSEMLLADPKLDTKYKKQIELMHQAGLRSRDLVRQLLAFSRKQTLEMEGLDVNRVLSVFQKLLQKTIRENIEIEYELSSYLPSVQADRNQLEQVILNLAVNAQDAMPEGGTLTIETKLAYLDERYAARHLEVVPGRYVQLMVSDTGQGMDKKIQEHIFEPFFTTKKLGEGTGLGLSTVYGIVKQHRGDIWVYSEPGRGTTFKIYLPVSEGIQQWSRPSSLEKKRGIRGQETVFVVEDNDMVRDLTVSFLKDQGYNVLCAANGSQCLDLLRTHKGPIDLLLTDVIIPDMNGKVLYEQVAKSFPESKVLYMSGYTENVICHHGVLDDGVAFLQKPFSIHDLYVKVREVFDRE